MPPKVSFICTIPKRRDLMEIEHNSRMEFYRKPFGAVTCGSEVRIRLAASGIGIPYAVHFIYKKDGGGEVITDMPYIMTVNGSSVYSATLDATENAGLIWYYFEIITDQGSVYYGNNLKGLGGAGLTYFHKPDNLFQITVYDEKYATPDWFKKSVAYQIFPDRFFNGNEDGSFLGERSDIIKRSWNEMPFYKAEQFGGEYKANDFFGGNLKGVIKKLPYLEELGISVIYLNPIFKAYSNHKYDTGSYEEIDPMFGDEETFKKLCAEAKKRGIRIILDGVFNHTGSDSKYFNKNGTYDSVGAYQSQSSPYYEWYRFSQWPDSYESWWGMKTLPQVEENCSSYREYLLSSKDAIVKKWLRMGAYGWRLDVVDELPDSFVTELRENVKKTNEEAVIIGEVWEDASNKIAYGERRRYFLGDGIDSVMNYPMRSALIDAALCRINAEELDDRLMSLKENYPAPAYYSLLNILSSHDVERILTVMCGAPSKNDVDREYQASYCPDDYVLAMAKKRVRLVMALQMTLPGVPCVFYGDEAGVSGYGDPFCRMPFPWDNIDGEMSGAYKKMIALRNSSEAFSTGEFECVYKREYVYAYVRSNAEDTFVVCANMSGTHEKIRLDTARFDTDDILNVFDENDRMSAKDGIYYIDLPPVSVKIYVSNESAEV